MRSKDQGKIVNVDFSEEGISSSISAQSSLTSYYWTSWGFLGDEVGCSVLFSSCEVGITSFWSVKSVKNVKLLMINHHGKCCFEVALLKNY